MCSRLNDFKVAEGIAQQNLAYDLIRYPERFCEAQRNASRVLHNHGRTRCGNDYTAHYLDKLLPTNDDNPNGCKKRGQRCTVSYSRRCRCPCPCLQQCGKGNIVFRERRCSCHH